MLTASLLIFSLILEYIYEPISDKGINSIIQKSFESFKGILEDIITKTLILFLFPVALPAVLLNVHIYDLYFVSFLFNFVQGYAHSGYNFKFLNKIFNSNDHHLHHTHFNYNYAALTKIPDWNFNTYKKI